MTTVELRWQLRGGAPADPGHALFAALTARLPETMHAEPTWGIAPLGGDLVLRVRTPLAYVPDFLAIADLPGLRLGGEVAVMDPAPTVHRIVPKPSLVAERVTFKVEGSCRLTRPDFAQALARRLEILGCPLPPWSSEDGRGYWIGPPSEARIRGSEVHGYKVRLYGLSPEASRLIQIEGMGGRFRMGWGWFDPG